MTANKLDDIIKRLNKIEKLFQEKPQKTKEQKQQAKHDFASFNQTDDSIADLLLASL